MSYKKILAEVIEDCRAAHKEISPDPDLKFSPSKLGVFTERVKFFKLFMKAKLNEKEKREIEDAEKNYLVEQDKSLEAGNAKLSIDDKKKYYELLFSFLVECADRKGLLKEEIPREKLEDSKEDFI
jgi:hypothetical protein